MENARLKEEKLRLVAKLRNAVKDYYFVAVEFPTANAQYWHCNAMVIENLLKEVGE